MIDVFGDFQPAKHKTSVGQFHYCFTDVTLDVSIG